MATRPNQAAALAITLAALAGLPAGTAAQDPGPSKGRGHKVYVVQMSEDPVLKYEGGVSGYRATRPARGEKVDPTSAHVVAYAAHLFSSHDAALSAAGGGNKVYSYGYVFNGFAAELTAEQAGALLRVPGVLSVQEDEARALDTSSTPSFLGLTDPGTGLWDRLGGVDRAGEDVVVGIVDGGIWPEHPSFSDRTGLNGNESQDGKLSYHQLRGWHGKCVKGQAFKVSDCNQKLIGARYYNAGWGGNDGIATQLPWEYLSPRDFGGHGTHTASTAAGNHGVPPAGAAAVFGRVSGMAPRARISVYKVCWQTPTGGSCFNSDSVAAIDQAVADGVDVINFSISGSTTSFRDPVEIAFLNAAAAGVFVAASAGNAGPTTSTVAHPGPWLTTVAAGTHNRSGEGSVTLGNGATYFGASVATRLGPVPLIDSTAAGVLPFASLSAIEQVALQRCFAAVDRADPTLLGEVVGENARLDPSKVSGKIVVCDRGSNARINKSLAVQEAGGAGMILVNTSVNSLNADFHFVPTVHLAVTDRAAVKAYAATSGATASISKATIVYDLPAPFTASFSSRGPLVAGNGDLLKPDLMAPGQDILAAVAPPGNAGRLFDVYSGTSMSSPHVAGLAALLRQAHPDWSPMAIKSALMTTGSDVLDGPSTNPLVIFRQGAGHVRPSSAVDPGLVFDSGPIDWIGFLCGTQLPRSYCDARAIPVLDPSNLNVASIAIGDLAGAQTVTRTVTNVGARGTYSLAVAGLDGITVSASPPSFTLDPGQRQLLQITFTRTTAAVNGYTGGQLTWSDGAHAVRIPAVIRPVPLAAPAQVSGSYAVAFGYSGAFTATARGLVPEAVTPGSVADDPTDSACSLTTPNAQQILVTVPAGTTYARFSLFDADVNPGSDLDLCVFRGTTLVGLSGSGTSAEEVDLLDPPADAYTVVVQGFGVAGSTPFKLHTWLLGSADAGNMTVTAPATATLGATGAIGLSFAGLTPGVKYLGSVAYGGTAGLPSPTIVRVDP